MKAIFFVLLSILVSSCSRYQSLSPEDIVAIRPVFGGVKFQYLGYVIGNDSVRTDKWHHAVNSYLSKHLANQDSFQTDSNPQRIIQLFENKKPVKYTVVKVVGLREFGYIQTKSRGTINYGIMGKDAFIDLTNNKIYIEKGKSKK